MYVLFVCFRAGNVHVLHLHFVCTSDPTEGATVVFISKELRFAPVMIGEFTLLPPEADILPFYIKKLKCQFVQLLIVYLIMFPIINKYKSR